MVAAGGPLRAEGIPKRRCQFEPVAVKPHLSPKKAMHDSLGFHAWPLYHQLNSIFLKEFFTKIGVTSRSVCVVITIFFK